MEEIDEAAARRAAEQTWAASPEIRDEFQSKEAFLAYRVALAKGKVHVYPKRAAKPAG